MSAESELRKIISKIDAGWRNKQFEQLDQCFHEDAIIVGPGYVEFGRGRVKCSESYREFATNASVLSYSESNHSLRIWDNTAVYTFAWEMIYQRKEGPVQEKGTDQMVFQLDVNGWQLVWRYIQFQPSN
jgi:hypothetical protein